MCSYLCNIKNTHIKSKRLMLENTSNIYNSRLATEKDESYYECKACLDLLKLSNKLFEKRSFTLTLFSLIQLRLEKRVEYWECWKLLFETLFGCVINFQVILKKLQRKILSITNGSACKNSIKKKAFIFCYFH